MIKTELTPEEEEICLEAYRKCPFGRDKLHHYIHTVMRERGFEVDGITQRGVADWLLKQPFHQVNIKPNRKAIDIKSVSLTTKKAGFISIDLFELPLLPNGRPDRGMRYVLTAVDVYTKYVWAEPMRNKTSETTQNTLYRMMRNDHILDEGTTFLMDNGVEFNQIKEVLEAEGKKVINTLPHVPQSNVVERYNSIIKSGIRRLVSLTLNNSWVQHLPVVIEGINKSRSVVTGQIPLSFDDGDIDVTKRMDKRYEKLYGGHSGLIFKVGDHVRLRLVQSTMKKKAPFWSKIVYEISQVIKPNRPFLNESYYIKKVGENSNIKGRWNQGDLQLTKS